MGYSGIRLERKNGTTTMTTKLFFTHDPQKFETNFQFLKLRIQSEYWHKLIFSKFFKISQRIFIAQRSFVF